MAPRYATPSPSAPRRAQQSHLRQFSKTSLDRTSLGSQRSHTDTASSTPTVRDSQSSLKRVVERTCTVSINESVIRDDVLLNLEILRGIKPGTLMSITAVRPDEHDAARPNPFHKSFSAAEGFCRQDGDAGRRYIFVVKDMPRDLRAKHPNVEVYVAKHIADFFGFKKGTQVRLAPIDDHAPAVHASHVELSFKDMYLSRADMWRLAVSQLISRTVYKGQVIFFMGTIKATVTTVFVDGQKAQSAFFGPNTRPIFRSECARYVLFIQMAREMWDFDSDGSGEIMFYKVVNGFLPALFKKWVNLKVKHFVSIVLFARVEYDTGLTTDLAGTAPQNEYYTGFRASGQRRPFKDFYRVVVSDMSSGEWTTILHQLKKEFNIFRKDISLHHQEAMDENMSILEDPAAKPTPSSRIKAESSLAMHGNFLEAINLASSQYAHDYIDRDLLRTGISIVVISPGSGVFEVDYENLRRTTEALVGNGIGIDLICIPKIPLHSVPLFRYRNPHYLGSNQRSQSRPVKSRDSTPQQPTPLVGSYVSLSESLSPSKLANLPESRADVLSKLYTDEWAFALPQWLHVSYWTGKSEEALSYQGITLAATDEYQKSSQGEFAPRCRLYDLQMRSVLETNEIETTPLQADPKYSGVTRKTESGDKSFQIAPNLKVDDTLFEPVYGFNKFTHDKLLKAGEISLWKQLQAFDESRARLPASRASTVALKLTQELDEVTHKHLVEDTGLFGSSVGDRKAQAPVSAFSSSLTSVIEAKVPDVMGPSQRDSNAAGSQPKAPAAKMPRLIRQISLGPKGFGIAAPKAAVVELRAEHINAMPIPTTPSKPTMPMHSVSPMLMPPDDKDQWKSDPSEQLQNTPTKPISIKPLLPNTESMSQLKTGSMMASGSIAATLKARGHRSNEDRDLKFSNALRAEDEQKLFNSKLLAGAMPELPSTLSPTTAMAPWLVLLNPSNPDVNKVDDALLYSRWQHVFPRPSEMRLMKWKSLSRPASVPLTTEYFPTKAQFDTEYQRQPYNIAQNVDDDLAEEPKSREDFLRELINARFAHGFQVVIGPSVAKAFGQKTLKIADIFSQDHVVEDGTSLFMSIGNTIHQLSCVNGTEVEVNIFLRKPMEASSLQPDQPLPLYKPAIRTLLDSIYESRQIDIVTPKPEKNWNYIDSYLAGHTDEMTENLRFWRARFVLIPMSSSHSSSVSKSQNGDNEEEIRLEGIKRLAQLWQRHRYLSPSERHFQSSGARRSKDPNPLDIVYKTEDPSVVIAAEMETLPLFENVEASHRKGQLISNKERFEKSNFNISALAEVIQQPVENGGIQMRNRRWHLRLHYNCFIGSDMTTWLLDNFEDLESREEAVELGNSLMVYEDEKDTVRDARKDRDRGIFIHVERRHPFRDGQYFYQIASEHAKPHPSGWLSIRRKDTSVPSTPISDQIPRDSSRPGHSGLSRPTSIDEENSPVSGATTPTVPQHWGPRPKVALSKVMKYDVDHRKKSYRPERINLHYDRLHNPDNCYHIRIDWMNTTAKLIEDAIKTWAAIATQHGLRLVEVPIAEACTITTVNPFRKPLPVKLALLPPSQRPVTYYDPNSLTPQTQPGRFYYQKALLRRFDFVLDVEAASNFPSNVDVSYSWGKPDFNYTQYIHRSGLLLAEITDDGDFLLLANRLYSNRTATVAQAPVRSEPPPNERVSRYMNSGGYANHGMPEPTPIASPMFRPVLFASASATRGPGPSLSDTVGIAPVAGDSKTSCSAIPGVVVGEHESLKDRFVAFCANEEMLEVFYKETLEKGATVSTPAVSTVSEHDAIPPESVIPVLGLPPGVLGGQGGGNGGSSDSGELGSAVSSSSSWYNRSAGTTGSTPSAVLQRRRSVQYP